MNTLYNKSFLTLLDLDKDEINELIQLAIKLKEEKKKGILRNDLKGKNIVLLFAKDSTRTRCSFEVASYDLGANVTYLGPNGSQMGKKESIKDTARVLGRMFDGIEYRGFEQQIVENLSEHSKKPVWNGLTNEYHPTQALADILTILEHLQDIKDKKVVYFVNGNNNVTHSLMIILAKLGGTCVVSTPKKYQPLPSVIEECHKLNAISGGVLTIENDPIIAATDADVLYTDVWVSMGEKDEVWEDRIKLLTPYQINDTLMNLAKPNSIYMHCLPAFHDLDTIVGKEIYEKFGISEMEVTDKVHESKKSVVFDQAENRLHTIKAIILATMVEKY